MGEVLASIELDDAPELDNTTRLGIDRWLEESSEIDGLPEPETVFELETGSWLDWGTELEGTMEFEDVAELGGGMEVGERVWLDAEMVLENHVGLDTDPALGYDVEGEAPRELEMYEDVRDPPMPPPRIDDCSEAVLRTMLYWETVGLL